MDYDVIVIGAGASGLTAAIAAARQGSSVLVIEQKEKAGKKILATGNGKCNFTNTVQDPECYRSDDNAFAMKVLSRFDVSKTLTFFEELGIYPKNREGYFYPNSEQAASVVQVLMMECERLKVDFRYHEVVKEIKEPYYSVVTKIIPEITTKKKSENFKSDNQKADSKRSGSKKANLNKADSKNTDSNIVDSKENTNRALLKKSDNPGILIDRIDNYMPNQDKVYHGRTLILAAGGCASPQFGSDGSGFALAKSLGHTIIKPLPALVQLKSPDKYCKTVSGVRTGAKVNAFAGQIHIAEEEGEVIFTDYGISGIPIFQISRFVAKAIDRGEKVHLNLDFLPLINTEELTQLINIRISQNPDKNLEEMMVGLLNHKLSYIILTEAGLDVYKNVKLVSEQEVRKIVINIKKFRMSVTTTNSFENAQVCAGGVSTKEIVDTTMESKLLKSLYLTGELVDVDGTCGGYNLQWAWSSGYLAGTAAGKNKSWEQVNYD